MIIEILYDIKAFLLIFFAALVAYGQIILRDEFWLPQIRASYVLAFGDFQEVKTENPLQMILFSLFTFFTSLVLMNLLIAIMSDSYERVQANAAAADARSLADMILEMEQIVNYFYYYTNGGEDLSTYSYLFYT